MFCVGDTIMYGNTGVCEIADIRRETFGGAERTYYVIHPVDGEESTIYCPVDNEKAPIRKLLTAEQIQELIRIMPDTEMKWIENDQLRRERFDEILKRGDHEELVKLIKVLYLNREEKERTGKKFHIADEKAMKEAEYMLYSEFAHVLKIQPDEVVPFIMGQLGDGDKMDDAPRRGTGMD